MASKAIVSTSAALVLPLALNLLFFSLVSSTSTVDSCSPPSPKPRPRPKPTPTPTPTPKPTPTTKSPPSPSPSPSRPATCPRDTLKFGSCINLLGIIGQNLGTPPKEPCCSLLQGLGEMEVAVCLCTTIKANVLGSTHLTLPVQLSMLLNYCDKKLPTGFICH